MKPLFSAAAERDKHSLQPFVTQTAYPAYRTSAACGIFVTQNPYPATMETLHMVEKKLIITSILMWGY